MIDGIYNVSLKTPFGALKAVVELQAKDDGSCFGKVKCMGKEAEFDDGTVDGDTFKFAAVMPTPLGKMDFKLDGKIDGDVFYAETDSKLGHIIIQGNRA